MAGAATFLEQTPRRGVKEHMRARLLLVTLASTLIQLGRPLDALAQCGSGYLGIQTFFDTTYQPPAAAMFSGTVIAERRHEAVLIVTFDVDRVWQGTIGKRVVIYRAVKQRPPVGATSAARAFDVGRRYVVIPHRVTGDERREFGMQEIPGDAFAVGFCGDGSRPWEVFADNELHKWGPGRAPE
jgi:hypothetical protein